MTECTRALSTLGSEPFAITLMLTRRCNMTCAHCSVESGPRIRQEPTDAEILSLVEQAADAGASAIQLTGGEPMLREKLVFQILKTAKQRGMKTALSTNGFWGKRRSSAWQKVRTLRRLGLGQITLSYDKYHAEFQGPEPALNIAAAAEWFDVPININITRVADEPEIAGLVAPFEQRHHAKMRFYDVQPVGRARSFPLAELRSETAGFCNACRAPALTDDGRVTACNGPSYFVAAGSPLAVGSTRDVPLAELFRRHRADPVLETIRTFGPSRLLSELEAMGDRQIFGLRTSHATMCDICLDINTNAKAVAALRERLADPQLTAERVAKRLVIDSNRSTGPLSPEFINGVGAARIWMKVASGGLPLASSETETLFGRSDVDWKRSALYLSECGLARAILPALDDHELVRWAPRFFVDRLRQAAVREGMRELVQREVIRRLDTALGELDARGVLLKGAALMAIDDATDAKHLPARRGLARRAAGDIDILVPQNIARRLKLKLLAEGFSGEPNASRTGPHHLSAVSFQGMAVEIHTRIMPSFWGLPEKEMLARARARPSFDRLSTLDSEGMLLHALVHSSAHLYSHGLRAAFDSAWIMRRFPDIDSTRLVRWVGDCAIPRAFWVPARVIHTNGFAELPGSLMQAAPKDERSRRLERVAQVRLFTALESAFDLNPFSKNAFFMMLQDSALGRVRYVAALFGPHQRESRRSAASRARRDDPDSRYSGLPFRIRQGVAQWRAFRRALAAQS